MKLQVKKEFRDTFNPEKKFKDGEIIDAEDWVRAEILISNHLAEEYEGDEGPSYVLAIPDEYRRIRESLNDRISQNMIPIAGYDYPFSMHRFQLTQEEYAAIMGMSLKSVQCEGTPEGAQYPFFTNSYEYYTTNRNGSGQYDGGVSDLLRILNKLTGRNLRLPTINEWEFVASNGGKDYSLECEKAVLHEIGNGVSNKMGIYDMLGNGRQLCYIIALAYKGTKDIKGWAITELIGKGGYDIRSNYFHLHDDRYNTAAVPASIRLVESEKPLWEIPERHKEIENRIENEMNDYEEDMHYWWEN